MDEPDYDVKKEIIMSKLDHCLKMIEDMREKHDLVELIELNSILLQVEKEIKEY